MHEYSEPIFDLAYFYELPDDGRHYELAHGRLVSEPSPGARHGRIASRINTALDVYVSGRQLGVVLTCDAGFVLTRNPDTLRAPDVAFVTMERYLALEDDSRPVPGPPDLAVEVLSPSDRERRVIAKVTDYMDAGTRLVWIVDPQDETVRVYRPSIEPTLLRAPDVLDGADVLPDLRLPVSQFFAL